MCQRFLLQTFICVKDQWTEQWTVDHWTLKSYTWNPKHRHEIQYWDIAMNWLGKILPICKMTRQWENTSRYQILGLATHCCVSKREAKDLQRRMFAIWESSKRIGNVDLSSIAEVVHTTCLQDITHRIYATTSNLNLPWLSAICCCEKLNWILFLSFGNWV